MASSIAIAPRPVTSWLFEGLIMLAFAAVLLFRVMRPLRRDLRKRARRGTLPARCPAKVRSERE